MHSLRNCLLKTQPVPLAHLAYNLKSDKVVHACVRDEDKALEAALESLGLVRQEDVLDTWFSSALWPHSTLGWPRANQTAYFYPTSTLITSRDIITLWVARYGVDGTQ
jgi:valyl-tRNA synthetase